MDLPGTVVFDYPTIAALTDFAAKQRTGIGASSEAQSAAVVPSGASAVRWPTAALQRLGILLILESSTFWVSAFRIQDKSWPKVAHGWMESRWLVSTVAAMHQPLLGACARVMPVGGEMGRRLLVSVSRTKCLASPFFNME
jgi:hypothetical protein